MPVFDFNDEPKEEKKAPECTYTVIRSSETVASPEHPILVLDNSNRKWEHHSWGVFTNPIRKTAFEFHNQADEYGLPNNAGGKNLLHYNILHHRFHLRHRFHIPVKYLQSSH